MFNGKEMPPIRLKLLNQDSVGIYSWRLVRCRRKDAIVKLGLVEVAFETSKTCRETIEEYRQIVWVLHFALRHDMGNIEPKTSSKTFVEVPRLNTFSV